MYKDLETKYGDLKDSVSLHESMGNTKDSDHILFKFLSLIVDLLFLIIRRQH
jgi:hypothetical protein